MFDMASGNLDLCIDLALAIVMEDPQLQVAVYWVFSVKDLTFVNNWEIAFGSTPCIQGCVL